MTCSTRRAWPNLLLAEYEGRPLAALMVFALGRRAYYLYGASTDEERNRMPTYLLQWRAMQWARARGCLEYDLWGVPDEDEQTLEAQFETRRDGLWGVYRFKRGSAGRCGARAARTGCISRSCIGCMPGDWVKGGLLFACEPSSALLGIDFVTSQQPDRPHPALRASALSQRERGAIRQIHALWATKIACRVPFPLPTGERLG